MKREDESIAIILAFDVVPFEVRRVRRTYWCMPGRRTKILTHIQAERVSCNVTSGSPRRLARISDHTLPGGRGRSIRRSSETRNAA